MNTPAFHDAKSQCREILDGMLMSASKRKQWDKWLTYQLSDADVGWLTVSAKKQSERADELVVESVQEVRAMMEPGHGTVQSCAGSAAAVLVDKLKAAGMWASKSQAVALIDGAIKQDRTLVEGLKDHAYGMNIDNSR